MQSAHGGARPAPHTATQSVAPPHPARLTLPVGGPGPQPRLPCGPFSGFVFAARSPARPAAPPPTPFPIPPGAPGAFIFPRALRIVSMPPATAVPTRVVCGLRRLHVFGGEAVNLCTAATKAFRWGAGGGWSASRALTPGVEGGGATACGCWESAWVRELRFVAAGSSCTPAECQRLSAHNWQGNDRRLLQRAGTVATDEGTN